MDRHEVGTALLHGLSYVGASEQRAVAKTALVLSLNVVGTAERQQVADLDIGQLLGASQHRAHQLLGITAAGVDPDVVRRANAAHCVFGRGHLAPVRLQPVHRSRR